MKWFALGMLLALVFLLAAGAVGKHLANRGKCLHSHIQLMPLLNGKTMMLMPMKVCDKRDYP